MSKPNEGISISFPGIVFAFFFEICLPLIISIYSIKYYKGKIFYFLIGIAGFVSSVGIESIMLFIIAKFVDKTSVAFYCFAGISPGLFEETGKYIYLNYLNSKEKKKSISINYGIGHGGIECFMVGLNLLTNLFAKDQLIKQGILKDDITIYICLMSIIERVFAIVMQISLSIIVYKSINEKKFIFYLLAIILHDGVDLIVLLKHKGFLTSIYTTEFIVGIFSFYLSFYAYNLYNNLSEEKIKEISKEDKKKIQ